MGVLQRFERRLGGLVEGAFAKVFKGGVEPVEIASALARETDDRRATSSNRVLVPNEFAVELASGDYARLSPYDRALCDELAEMVREHAAEQRYTFVGPVTVRLAEAADLDVGVFRIRSSVAAADQGLVAGRRPRPRPSGPGMPHLLITTKAPSGGPGGGANREYPLDAETTVIGRSVECDIRLNDTGVSRRHGEIRRLPDGQFLYVDAGSTNGSLVNGRAATQVKLVPGDTIELGTATIVFQREDGRGSGPARGGHHEMSAPDRRRTPVPPDPYERGSGPRGGPVDPYGEPTPRPGGTPRPGVAPRPERTPRPGAGYREERPRERGRAPSDPGGYRDRDPGYDRDQDRDRDRGYDPSTDRGYGPGARDAGYDRAAERDRGPGPAHDRTADRGGRDPYRRDARDPAPPRDRQAPRDPRDPRGGRDRRDPRDGAPRRPDGYREPSHPGRQPAAGASDGLEPLDDVYEAQTFLPGQGAANPPGGDGGRGRSRSDRGW